MSAATSEDVLQVLSVVREVQKEITKLQRSFIDHVQSSTAFQNHVVKTLDEIKQTVSVLEGDVMWARGQIREHDAETTVIAARLEAMEESGGAE